MEIHITSNHIYLNQNNYLMMCWSSSSQSLRQYRGMNYCQLKKEFLQMMTNPVFCCIFICCWGWNFVKRHRNFRGYEQILYSRIRCVLVALFGRLVNLLPWVSPLIPQSKMVPSYNFTKKSHYHDHLDEYHDYYVGHFEDHSLTWKWSTSNNCNLKKTSQNICSNVPLLHLLNVKFPLMLLFSI